MLSSLSAPVGGMLSTLLVLCTPLSWPSLYLAYRLYRKSYLGTVFNQQAALVLAVCGEDKRMNRKFHSKRNDRAKVEMVTERNGNFHSFCFDGFPTME